MLAVCFASGHIEFAARKPKGSIEIARGEPRALHDFICSVARHGYSTEMVKGRRTKVPGSDTLLVPGVPEAELFLGPKPSIDEVQAAKSDKLEEWLTWIASHAPVGVKVNLSCKRGVPGGVASKGGRAEVTPPLGLARAAR